jgi:hypothetical protein
MSPHRLTEFSVPITFAIFLAHAASAQVTDRMKACPCRKLKLEHIDGVVRLKVAPELRGLRFGRHAR